MRSLLVGVSLLAMLAPAAHAQEAGAEPPAAPAQGQAEPGRFLVFFDYNKASLSPEGREVVGQAAEAYNKTGAARLAVTGYADTAGPDSLNLALSRRRAQAVRRELVRLGVPADVITTTGAGESNLLVPTADGVPEARNRRVEIEVPGAAGAPGATPMAAAEAPPPAKPASTSSSRRRGAGRGLALSVGGFFGHNFRESDTGSENRLGGAEVALSHRVFRNVVFSLGQSAFRSLDGEEDGWGGRSVIGLALQHDLGRFHPYLGANVGVVYGEGVQDGLIAGPEAGLKLDVGQRLFVYGKGGYDYQFRNPSWDEGIVQGGLGVGLRF